MSDEATRIQRGRAAELELKLTREAFKASRAALLEAIAQSPLDASSARERLYLSVGLLAQVEQLLIDCVNDGVVAMNAVELAEHFNAQRETRLAN